MAGSGSLYDVRLVWREGYESNVTVRARSPKEARSKAREFALNITTARPNRVSVKRVHFIK